MPVIRRRLASSPAHPSRSIPTPIRRPQPQVPQPQQLGIIDQRGMNLKVAAKYAGVSVWQIRRWIREGELKPAVIGNKHILDRAALDRLLDGLFAEAAA